MSRSFCSARKSAVQLSSLVVIGGARAREERWHTRPNVSLRLFFWGQVGIAKEKVVNIGRLSELAAAELFVATAPREVRSALILRNPTLAYLRYPCPRHPPSVLCALLPCEHAMTTPPSGTIFFETIFSEAREAHTTKHCAFGNVLSKALHVRIPLSFFLFLSLRCRDNEHGSSFEGMCFLACYTAYRRA